MSEEDLPPTLKMKLYSKILRRISEAKREEELRKKEQENPRKIVEQVLADSKAREFLDRAFREYPEAAEYAVSVIAQLVKRGIIKEIDGVLMLELLNRLGVPIRPEMKIRFVKRGGKEVDLKEYLE